MAAEAREQADGLRQQLAGLEATGTAQSAEVTTLREALVSQQSLAANLTVLVDETDLPFPDNAFDRVVLMHALEHAEAFVRRGVLWTLPR